MPDENVPDLIPAVIAKTETATSDDIPGRLAVVESRVDRHDQLIEDQGRRVVAIESGNAELTRQIASLNIAMAALGADVKLAIERTFNGLLRDALNAVPARVAVWFGAITAAVAVAAVFIQKML